MFGKKNGAVGGSVFEDAYWRPHVTGVKHHQVQDRHLSNIKNTAHSLIMLQIS